MVSNQPVLAEVWRGEVLESVHHGSVVMLSPDGEVLASLGYPDAVVYPRSSNKPLQALAMLRHGLDLPPELLALACASHSGEPFHLEGVRAILAAAGLSEGDLQCTPGLPIGEQAQRDRLDAGHLCRGGVADLDLPRGRPPAAAGNPGHHRATRR